MSNDLTANEKGISLFNYLHELSGLRQKTVVNVKDYLWCKTFADIPNDENNIEIVYRDRVEEENLDVDPAILRVHKPEYAHCPSYPRVLEKWLKDSWDDFEKDDFLIATQKFEKATGRPIFKGRYYHPDDIDEVKFDDDKARVSAYENWKILRDEWVKTEETKRATRELFNELYKVYLDYGRDSETLEVVVANGFLRDSDSSAINHPVLTRRVGLSFDASRNVISVNDVDVTSELQTMIFQEIRDVDLSSINELQQRVREEDLHPLDRNDTSDFLSTLVHYLSSKSLYEKGEIPEHWEKSNRFLMHWEPTLILRKRMDGTRRFIQEIIDNIKETGYFPTPLMETVSGGKVEVRDDFREISVEQQLAAVGGEDPDILLSKEANKEQLEIAQRIETYNAVLVQGPPGTGKTHTIANLLGHFLAQGKNVLVTSHTQKALSVLKEKVNPNIQHLCVSVLNDSNVDMERSVDGITSYMASHTSFELNRDIQVLKEDRAKVIEDLGKVRHKIFEIIKGETEDIVLDGETFSPSNAASFVFDNSEKLSQVIPGRINESAKFPLTLSETVEIYRSNADITEADEREMRANLPALDKVPSPEGFYDIFSESANARTEIKRIEDEKGWTITLKDNGIHVKTTFSEFDLEALSDEWIEDTLEFLKAMENPEKWMARTALDGKRGGQYADRWNILSAKILETCQKSEEVVGLGFGKTLSLPEGKCLDNYAKEIQQIQDKISSKGKIGKLDLMFNSKLAEAFESIKINGEQIGSEEDCKFIVAQMELNKLRKECAAYWDVLFTRFGDADFYSLDMDEPERIAARRVPVIEKNLRWIDSEFAELKGKLSTIGLSSDCIYDFDDNDSESEELVKVMRANKQDLPALFTICKLAKISGTYLEKRNELVALLHGGKNSESVICKKMVEALESDNFEAYKEAYEEFEGIYAKGTLKEKRKLLIDKVAIVAPEWADCIEHRRGVHGECVVPDNLEEAWKWKRLNSIISSMVSESYSQLLDESLDLSKTYRKTTAEYAEKLAWYHLLKRTENDISMRQALQGWKQTVKRIGKGTGKSAPKLRAQARRLMAMCQSAVPAWIMPMNRVIETLSPINNRYDVVIVDEASQSDVTALAVLYLGKKIIIVGDDKQVSPSGIGTLIERTDALERMYLKDVIPNSHLYTANASLYDIAATTYQPLMLREHFRCVPDIIGFSNGLSYDYKIKPLRASGSSNLTPAVVSYKVPDGMRERKSNLNEAKAIVSLLKACMKRKEYDGKTFGVISLLGDEQVKMIQQLIEMNIDAAEQEKRRLLCGNSAHFQGDERDVIFLSMVDSNEAEGPLALHEFGANDSTRKRYNVAASRAKDQLWVVHSLNSATDLKSGDIRKRLIEYAENPGALEEIHNRIDHDAESPFEAAVARALCDRGYHLEQQVKVGAYRLDMVAVNGKTEVAIECDGERWHSGESKIREDMERQTILERSGWKFIRVRGSEYYSNPEAAINRIIQDLDKLGVSPEASDTVDEKAAYSELVNSVISESQEIQDDLNTPSTVRYNTIASALDSGNQYHFNRRW